MREGWVALLLLSALVLAQFGATVWPPIAALNLFAVAAAVVLAGMTLRHAAPVARVFALAALLIGLWLALTAPQDLLAALRQATAFSAFLTALGMIRAPVRASNLIARASNALFAAPASALLLGAQALSVVFNIGTIGMMSDIARAHPSADLRATTLAALRGTILMTVWNPLGIGFAIITSAINALEPLYFLALNLAAALALSLGVSLFEPARPAAPQASPRALIGVMAAVAAVLAATFGLHLAFDVAFLVAACLVLPVIGLLWPWLEAGVARVSPPEAVGAAARATTNESTIFFAAAVIGAGVLRVFAGVAFVPEVSLGWLLGLLIAIPLLAAFFVPHTVMILLAAQILGAGPLATAHPYALGLSLSLAWAFSIAASPISAMSILSARQLAIAPREIPFSLNSGFVLGGLCAAMLSVTLTYLFE